MSNVNVMNDLTPSEIHYNYERMQRDLYKLQIDITKKDKEIQALQTDLQVFKKSTNSTSSQFPFISEFKDKWTFLLQNLIMDTFDTIYSNSILLSSVVQMTIASINEQTKLYIHTKIILLLSVLGITEHNDNTIHNFFIKFRKILLQDYYKTLFICDVMFIDTMIEILKRTLIEERVKEAPLISGQEKIDIMKDLNAVFIRKFIEEAFYICLYMNLHDPPLMFNISYQPIYYYFSKSELINIEGFAVDNSPCLLILYPPMLRNKNSYQGMKAAVYACDNDKITEEILLQCHNNQIKKQENLKVHHCDVIENNDIKKSFINEEEENKGCYHQNNNDCNSNSDINSDRYSNSNHNNNNNHHHRKSSPIIVNDFQKHMISNYIKETNKEKISIEKEKNEDNNNKSTNKSIGKDTRPNHHIEKMININDNNYILYKREPQTSYSLSKSTHKDHKEENRSKSLHKPNQQCIRKYIQKPSFNKNTNNNNSKQSYLSFGNKSNQNTLIKSKPKEKSYTISIEEQKQHINHTNKSLKNNNNNNPSSSRNSNHLNNYDISQSFDPSLITDNRKSTGNAINIYLKTPLPKRRDSSNKDNNNNQSPSSKNDTPNQSSLKHPRYNSNINSIIAYNQRQKKANESEMSIINNNNISTNMKTNSIKKTSSKGIHRNLDNTITQENVQREISYNNKPKNYNHITRETHSNYSSNNTSKNQPLHNSNNNHDSFSYRNVDNCDPSLTHFYRNNTCGYNSDNHLFQGIINFKNKDNDHISNINANVINNSSTNSLLTNNSNIQQLNKVSSSYQTNTNSLNPNQFLNINTTATSGLNYNRTSLNHGNKLEYITTTSNNNSNSNNTKNNPTIIFNDLTGLAIGISTSKVNDYSYKHINRTDYNSQPLPNSTTVATTFNNQRGGEMPSSNRTITATPVAFATITDSKLNGFKKKGAIFPGAYKITDIQLNYDASSMQYQQNGSQSLSHNIKSSQTSSSTANANFGNQILSHNNLNAKCGNQLYHRHNNIQSNIREQEKKQYPIQLASKKVTKIK